MRIHLIAPLLGVLACGDNLHPSEDELTPVTADETDEKPPHDGDVEVEARPITTFFIYDYVSCDDNSVWLEARTFYADDLSLVDNAICQYSFEDGTQLFGCGVVKSLPTAQNVVLTVRDPDTDAIATFEEVVRGPSSFDATFAVSSDDLTISWDVSSTYGEVANAGGVRVSIEPSENLVEPLPMLAPFQGSVQVTEPGTYTVSIDAFISFGEAGGCARSYEETLEVTTCAADGHAH